MTTIRLHNDCPNTYISVPGVFIDKYMTDANGEFVKVYLYLLYCMNTDSSECSVSAIADHFNHTENDVLRALKYWEKAGILNLETNEQNDICGISFRDFLSQPEAAAKISKAETVSKSNTNKKPQVAAPALATSKKEYSVAELQKFSTDPDVAELLFIIEQYLKRTLNSTEMNTVIYWIDSLHLSKNLAEYLVEYCVDGGHTSLHYMNKVALGWAQDGITTVEEAKDHSSNRSKACYQVMKALGICGRNLIDTEISFINKWTKEFGFDMILIEEACKRTISATHQPSFEYTDSILTNWHNKQVHNLQDVAALDASFSKSKKASSTARTVNSAKNNKFINFTQRSYDFEELEKDILTTSVQ